MLNMLKVHGGNRVAQGPGNRTESLSAGSPGMVIAGTESFIKQQLLSSVEVSATHRETLHHRDTSL